MEERFVLHFRVLKNAGIKTKIKYITIYGNTRVCKLIVTICLKMVWECTVQSKPYASLQYKLRHMYFCKAIGITTFVQQKDWDLNSDVSNSTLTISQLIKTWMLLSECDKYKKCCPPPTPGIQCSLLDNKGWNWVEPA